MNVKLSFVLCATMLGAVACPGSDSGPTVTDDTLSAVDPGAEEAATTDEAATADPAGAEADSTAETVLADPAADPAAEKAPEAVDETSPEASGETGPEAFEETAAETPGEEVTQPVCQPACNVDEDCGFPGYFCQFKKCAMRSTFCFDQVTAMNDRGEWSGCGAYRCGTALGQCIRSASSTDDCAPGYVWDGDQGCTMPMPMGFRASALGLAPSLPQLPAGCDVACSKDSDCTGRFCFEGTCRKIGNYCLIGSDGWQSAGPVAGAFGPDGNLTLDLTTCDPAYRCDPVNGECRTDCVSTDDCAPGKNCDLGTRICL